MKITFKQQAIAVSFIILLIFSLGEVLAINTWNTGYSVSSSVSSVDISLGNADGTADSGYVYRIFPIPGKNLFIPTKTSGEWIAFESWANTQSGSGLRVEFITSPSVQSLGCTYCANEGGRCSFSGEWVVSYGIANTFNTKTLIGGTFCTNAVFGDPVVGATKKCYLGENCAVTEEPSGNSCIYDGDCSYGQVCNSGTCEDSTAPDPCVGCEYGCKSDFSGCNPAPETPGCVPMSDGSCSTTCSCSDWYMGECTSCL